MRSSAQFRYLCSTLCICALLSVCSASGPFSWLFGATSPCSSPTGGTQQGQWVCVDQSTGLPAPSANCSSPTPATPACCSAGCVDPVSFSAVTCSGSVIGTSKRLSITCSVNVTMPSGKTLSNLDFGRLHGMPTEVSAALFNQTGAVQTTNYSLPVGGNTIQWAHWFNVKTPDGFWPNAGGWFHASFLYLRLDGSIWDSDKPQLILAAGDPTLVGECAMLMCPLGMYSNTQIDCTIQQPMDSPLTNTPMFIDASDIQFSSSSRQLSYGGISHLFFDPTLRLTIVSQKITGTITVSTCSSGSNCSECSEQSSEFIVAYAPVSTISTLSCDPNQLMYGDNLRSDWAFCSTTLQTDTPFDTLPLVNANNTALIIRSSVDGAIVTIAGPMVATFSFNNTGYDVQWVLAPPQWDSPKVYTGFANMVAQYIQPDGQVVLSAEANVLVYYPSANVTSIFLACPDTVTVTSADNGDPTACSVLAKVGNTEVFINAQDLNITSNDPNFDLGIAAYDPKVPESRLLWIPAYVYGASGLQHTINVQLLSLSTSATIRAVPPAQPSSSGPSGGVIAGAVIGSLVGATLAGFLIYRFYFKSNSPSNFGISVSTADDTPVEYRAL